MEWNSPRSESLQRKARRSSCRLPSLPRRTWTSSTSKAQDSGSISGAGDGSAPLPPSPRVALDSWQLREMVSLLGLLFFAALLHSRSLLIGYMADDYDLIYALNRPNFSLLDPLPFGRGTYFRPTVMLSLMLELRSGGGPVIHHAVNLAIHLVNGALLFLILRRLRANPFLACSLTFLFLCHRSSVPNVYWISPRAELLATSGYLMAVIGALHYSNARFAMGSAMVTLFGVVLALLSKESAVTIPIALALFLWMAGRETSDSTERRLVWPLVAAGAVLCLIYLIYLAGRFYVRSAGMPIASPVEMAAGAAKGAVLLLLPISESLSDSLSHGVARGPLLVAFAALSIPLMIFWARRNLRAVALTVGLPLLAFLPLLVIQGGGGARVLYLPAALLIIGAAVSSRT